MLEHFPVQNLETPARVLDGQAVIITPQDAVLHTLNEVGTFIWARSDGRRTVQQIVAELVETFEVTPAAAAEDTRGFIEACVRLGLMHLSPQPSPVDLGPVLAGTDLV